MVTHDGVLELRVGVTLLLFSPTVVAVAEDGLGADDEACCSALDSEVLPSTLPPLPKPPKGDVELEVDSSFFKDANSPSDADGIVPEAGLIPFKFDALTDVPPNKPDGELLNIDGDVVAVDQMLCCCSLWFVRKVRQRLGKEKLLCCSASM